MMAILRVEAHGSSRGVHTGFVRASQDVMCYAAGVQVRAPSRALIEPGSDPKSDPNLVPVIHTPYVLRFPPYISTSASPAKGLDFRVRPKFS